METTDQNINQNSTKQRFVNYCYTFLILSVLCGGLNATVYFLVKEDIQKPQDVQIIAPINTINLESKGVDNMTNKDQKRPPSQSNITPPKPPDPRYIREYSNRQVPKPVNKPSNPPKS